MSLLVDLLRRITAELTFEKSYQGIVWGTNTPQTVRDERLINRMTPPPPPPPPPPNPQKYKKKNQPTKKKKKL